MSRCPACGSVVAGGPNCEVEDNTCFSWSGDGSSADPHTLVPILSADPDQLLTCEVDGLEALIPTAISEPPSVYCYRSSDFKVTNNTMTTVLFNIEFYDTDTMHDISTNSGRITFTTAGVYVINFTATWEGDDTTSDRFARVRKNGTDTLAIDTREILTRDILIAHNMTVIHEFAATDYVEAQVQQNSGSTQELLSGSDSITFAASRMA